MSFTCMHKSQTRYEYDIHGCISVARGQESVATVPVSSSRSIHGSRRSAHLYHAGSDNRLSLLKNLRLVTGKIPVKGKGRIGHAGLDATVQCPDRFAVFLDVGPALDRLLQVVKFHGVIKMGIGRIGVVSIMGLSFHELVRQQQLLFYQVRGKGINSIIELLRSAVIV